MSETPQWFEMLLVRHDIVDSSAIEDAEGYDNGRTKSAINDAFNELARRSAESRERVEKALANAAGDLRDAGRDAEAREAEAALHAASKEARQ